jgi:hypothetical protein
MRGENWCSDPPGRRRGFGPDNFISLIWPWLRLRSLKDPSWFHSEDFPKRMATLSSLTLSTLRNAMVQASENCGQQQFSEHKQSQHPAWFPLLSCLARSACKSHSKVARAFPKYPMQGLAPGCPPAPPCGMPLGSWHGLWRRGGSRHYESGGVGHVGCETIWETTRASKESFVSGIPNSKFFTFNISVTRRWDKNLCHSTGFHICFILSDFK